jgi:hypothetical protein
MAPPRQVDEKQERFRGEEGEQRTCTRAGVVGLKREKGTETREL